jgi:hypothetical protein
MPNRRWAQALLLFSAQAQPTGRQQTEQIDSLRCHLVNIN